MSGGQAAISADVVVRSDAILGEGPLWDDAAEELLWVDIPAGLLHRSDPATGEDRSVQIADSLGAIGLRAGGGLVAVADGGFGLVDERDRFTLAHAVASGPGETMNDAKCDAAGRFWGGLARARATPARGTLFSWGDPASPPVAHWDDLTLPNGLGWSPDERTFYLADSYAHVVFAAPFDLETGVLGPRRVLIELAPTDGLPDGLCIDIEGCVWLAIWDGGEIRRYAPDGRLLKTVAVPVSRPSSCVLAPGGTLYITSARPEIPAGALQREPLAGSVFAADVGVGAAPARRFGA